MVAVQRFAAETVPRAHAVTTSSPLSPPPFSPALSTSPPTSRSSKAGDPCCSRGARLPGLGFPPLLRSPRSTTLRRAFLRGAAEVRAALFRGARGGGRRRPRLLGIRSRKWRGCSAASSPRRAPLGRRQRPGPRSRRRAAHRGALRGGRAPDGRACWACRDRPRLPGLRHRGSGGRSPGRRPSTHRVEPPAPLAVSPPPATGSSPVLPARRWSSRLASAAER